VRRAAGSRNTAGPCSRPDRMTDAHSRLASVTPRWRMGRLPLPGNRGMSSHHRITAMSWNRRMPSRPPVAAVDAPSGRRTPSARSAVLIKGQDDTDEGRLGEGNLARDKDGHGEQDRRRELDPRPAGCGARIFPRFAREISSPTVNSRRATPIVRQGASTHPDSATQPRPGRRRWMGAGDQETNSATHGQELEPPETPSATAVAIARTMDQVAKRPGAGRSTFSRKRVA